MAQQIKASCVNKLVVYIAEYFIGKNVLFTNMYLMFSGEKLLWALSSPTSNTGATSVFKFYTQKAKCGCFWLELPHSSRDIIATDLNHFFYISCSSSSAGQYKMCSGIWSVSLDPALVEESSGLNCSKANSQQLCYMSDYFNTNLD